MRWLMYFTLGFSGACACCVWLESGFFWIYAMLIVLLAASVWVNARLLSITAMLLAGFAAGQLWYGAWQAFYLKDAAALDGTVQSMTIRASDYSEDTGYGLSVDGTLTWMDKPYQVRVYLDAGDGVSPGQLLMGEFQFRVTRPELTSHPGGGVFLLAYQAGAVHREGGAQNWRDFPAILRQRIQGLLTAHFPADAAPLAKALLLGDTTDVSYAVDTDLKVSGIRHVAAVSGLHVSILFALVSTVTLHSRFLSALLGFPVLLLFAALAGFTPSVSRSCLMCALMLLGLLTNREYDGPTALSFAVLVLLLLNPLAITSVSLQLSAASVAGIFLFQGRIQAWLRSKCPEGQLSRWLCGSVSITLSAMTLTTPLCAWYFGMVSLVGVLTNLLTLWVISGIFYGILGVCLLHFALPSLAPLLASVVAVPIRYVLWTAHALAGLPLAAVYTCSPYITAWLAFLGLLLAVFLLSRGRRPVVFACCALLSLCAALGAGWTELGEDDIRFTVLDVGQGQCLLFEADGKTVLVDCGGGRDTQAADLAAQTLLSRGYDHLDVLILTHMDKDHAAGAEKLLSRMEADLLVMPNMPTQMDTGKAGQILWASSSLDLALGGAEVRVYSPEFPGIDNEMSLCVLFDTQKCDILVTGDRSGFGERMLLRQETLPKVDVLVAGHHGAEDAVCQELLAAVRPETVCISVGAGNPHGHPAPQTLARLQAFGCEIYRTDIQGTITIRR